MPLASPYTWNEQVKTIRLRSGAISRTDENSSQLQMVLFRRAAELNMLLTVRPEEERRGLSAGAGSIGAEQAIAGTVGDAVLLGPRHSLRIVSVRRYVAEPGAAAHGGAARRALQERRTLGAGAGGVGAEQAVACTVGDAVFNGPRHSLRIVSVCRYVAEPGAAAHGGAARRALQERRTLGAGAVQVGTEGGVRSALGDLALEHPLHCADIVGVVCHVRKGIHPGEGCLHRDLVGGHLKGVSTIAVVLDGQLLALEIPDDHTIRLVMALRLHGDGHLVALGRAGLGEGNGAVGVFTHLCLDGMGGGTVGGIPVGGSPPAGSPELPPGVVSFSLVGSSEPRTRQVLHT